MLQIPKKLLLEIQRQCEEGYPGEVCGLLLGKLKKEVCIILKIFPAENLNKERAQDRYELNPQDFLKADQLARREGFEIVGIYHSHPDHSPDASQTDTERAWEGYSYLILAIHKGRLDSFKSWRLNEDQMVEEEVEVING